MMTVVYENGGTQRTCSPSTASAGSISLAKSPGALDRFAFHERNGALGGIRTHTEQILSLMPLLLGYEGVIKEMVPAAGVAPTLSPF